MAQHHKDVHFGGLVRDFTVKSVPWVTKSRFAAMRYYKGETLLTLWCKPEANNLETSLLQLVALCEASLLRAMPPPPL